MKRKLKGRSRLSEAVKRSAAKARHPKSLVQFFRESPLVGAKLDLERDKDAGRDVKL
jgi:hypothetical protein